MIGLKASRRRRVADYGFLVSFSYSSFLNLFPKFSIMASRRAKKASVGYVCAFMHLNMSARWRMTVCARYELLDERGWVINAMVRIAEGMRWKARG